MAKTREEANEKLKPHLKLGHGWYLQPGAENPREQGHLTVKEIAFDKGVACIS
jgi:hypothetical protein